MNNKLTYPELDALVACKLWILSLLAISFKILAWLVPILEWFRKFVGSGYMANGFGLWYQIWTVRENKSRN